MRPHKDKAPVLDIPAPPLNELGDAFISSWTKYFRWLVDGNYSCIVIHRCRSYAGFKQALRRYLIENKGKPTYKKASKIGIIMCFKDAESGRPSHWEIRPEETPDEQRISMSHPAFTRWRRHLLNTLLERGKAPLEAPIEADAIQWWLYSRFYNRISRKTTYTELKAPTLQVLKGALKAKLLTAPEHWLIIETAEGLELRISDALRQALQVLNA